MHGFSLYLAIASSFVAFSDYSYTQPKDIMPAVAKLCLAVFQIIMIILHYGINRSGWTIYVLIGPVMLWHKWSGRTNYVEHKWSPWTTYARATYAVTVYTCAEDKSFCVSHTAGIYCLCFKLPISKS